MSQREPAALSAIVVEHLTRRFDGFTAVDDVSFTVESGEVFGFLGPNGAGKTTTISMITTLLRPTSGRASVDGHDIDAEAAAVRRSIGIVFQEPSLDDRLTATENLEFHAVLYQVPASERRHRIRAALELVDLSDRAGDLVEKFSGGMKRRLEIARGLLHTPRVLFLDEPTIGLDPQTRRSLWDHIVRLRREADVTIFMTTHYMEEAEVCDRIGIIDHGRVVALDTPDALKRAVGGDVVTIATDDPDGLVAHLAADGVEGRRHGRTVLVETPDGARFIPHVVRRFAGAIEGIELRRPTLDDVFLKLTGRTIRESELGEDDIARNRMRSMMQRRRRH
jgi:ABC-2 type transport system ATP-binding protein